MEFLKKCCFLIILLSCGASFAQTHLARTAHISVKSSNDYKNIEADNYQVRGTVDIETGMVNFKGLLKSFEFKLGALDRIFNSDKLNVTEHPSFSFEGRIMKHKSIPFNKPGIYKLEIRGKLYMWDEKRFTTAKGSIEVLADRSFKASSDFVIKIEEKNVEKINKLLRNRLPKLVSVDLNTFGVSREILIKLNANFKTLRP